MSLLLLKVVNKDEVNVKDKDKDKDS